MSASKDEPVWITLLARQMRARAANRERWRKDANELLDAHLCASSAIASLIFRSSGHPLGEIDESIEGRMSLMSLFVQGIDLCEVSIAEGLYSQAGTLLRQEAEIIEAIHQHETGRRTKAAPKLAKLKTFGRLYGELTALAHVSHDRINATIVAVEQDGMRGPSILPVYDAKASTHFYGLHISFIAKAFQQLLTLNADTGGPEVSGEEGALMGRAIELVAARGLIKFKD